MAPGLRCVDLRQPCRRTAVEHLAAVLAGGRTDIDDPVGVADHVQLVLDDEQRIAGRLQPVEAPQQRLGVGGMQAGGRLVEHIDDAEQIRAHLGGQAQPLQLARRQRGRAAFEREIAEAEIEQHRRAARMRSSAMRCVTIAFSGCSMARLAVDGRGAVAHRASDAGQALQRQLRNLGDVEPANLTESASGAGACHGTAGNRCSTMYCETRFFISALSVLAKVCSTYFLAPVKVPM